MWAGLGVRNNAVGMQCRDLRRIAGAAVDQLIIMGLSHSAGHSG
jgi:hypothetical protein